MASFLTRDESESRSDTYQYSQLTVIYRRSEFLSTNKLSAKKCARVSSMLCVELILNGVFGCGDFAVLDTLRR